ncbi:MAG TPA: hypothetical protein PLJ21_10735, partial [Pseudobdellovibrionaceae bacterium]|nr:hypothetical protein [Pseudobdellovibrionaceae bacterium]
QLDNPSLNVRYPGLKKQNRVIVLDPKAAVLNRLEDFELAKIHKKENLLFVLDEQLKNSYSDRKDIHLVFVPLII